MNRSGLLYAIMLLLLLSTVLPAAATSLVSSENELQQSVIALDRARNRAVHDLAEKKQHGVLEEKQQQDYERFIIFLTVKIGEYCRQLRSEAGDAAVEGLPCPEGEYAYGAFPEAGSVQTSEEQVADLESLLVASLEQFDEKLLKEEERLAARQPKDRETGYGSGGSQGQPGGGGGAAAGQTSGQGSESSQSGGSEGTAGQGSGSSDAAGSEGNAGQNSQGGATDGPLTAQGGDGSATGSGEGAGPSIEGAGSGQSAGSGSQQGKVELETRDDDVVARQLREAAEKETDPELKKKLWEEYRKYKEGVR